jgi:hypothetical protein
MKNFPKDIEAPFSGELQKRGRQTSMLMSRWYEIRDGALLQFQAKSDVQPKRKIFVLDPVCRHYIFEGPLL